MCACQPTPDPHMAADAAFKPLWKLFNQMTTLDPDKRPSAKALVGDLPKLMKKLEAAHKATQG